MAKITITVDNITLEADLNDSLTAEKIAELLPIEGHANVWGDEIYFNIPLNLEVDANARADVDVGELGYWPAGPAFCIFYGPTPVSTDERPRAYSPVNVFGKISGDATRLKGVANGAAVKVSRA